MAVSRIKKIYIIYDARAVEDVDSATICEVCETLKEAQQSAPDYGNNCVIYSYDDDGTGTLKNEKFEEVVQ